MGLLKKTRTSLSEENPEILPEDDPSTAFRKATKALRTEVDKLKRRNAIYITVLGIGAALFVIAISLAVINSRRISTSNRDRIEESEAAEEQADFEVCVRANESRANIRDAFTIDFLDAVVAIGGSTDTPEGQARLEAFRQALAERLFERIPDRACVEP